MDVERWTFGTHVSRSSLVNDSLSVFQLSFPSPIAIFLDKPLRLLRGRLGVLRLPEERCFGRSEWIQKPVVAKPDHLRILEQGVSVWNEWRRKNPKVAPDLGGAFWGSGSTGLAGINFRATNLKAAWFTHTSLAGGDLSGANLTEAVLIGTQINDANLQKANLRKANLSECTLSKSNFNGADLRGAQFYHSIMTGANLSKTDCRGSRFCYARLLDANVEGANLAGADLTGVSLLNASVSGAIFSGARVYGLAAWNLKGDPKETSHLIITDENEPHVTVDDLEVAQLFHLILNNRKIRSVLETSAKKLVLILGRFTKKRKAVLDALRSELHRKGHVPVIFDFDRSSSRNLTETVSTLAHLARFVIADLTDPKSIPQELQRIVLLLPSVPVQPVILDSQEEYSMFGDFFDYPWVLPPFRYRNTKHLIASLEKKVIAPAIQRINARARVRKGGNRASRASRPAAGRKR